MPKQPLRLPSPPAPLIDTAGPVSAHCGIIIHVHVHVPTQTFCHLIHFLTSYNTASYLGWQYMHATDIQGTCATTGDGLYDSLDWIQSTLTEREVKRTVIKPVKEVVSSVSPKPSEKHDAQSWWTMITSYFAKTSSWLYWYFFCTSMSVHFLNPVTILVCVLLYMYMYGEDHQFQIKLAFYLKTMTSTCSLIGIPST